MSQPSKTYVDPKRKSVNRELAQLKPWAFWKTDTEPEPHWQSPTTDTRSTKANQWLIFPDQQEQVTRPFFVGLHDVVYPNESDLDSLDWSECPVSDGYDSQESYDSLDDFAHESEPLVGQKRSFKNTEPEASPKRAKSASPTNFDWSEDGFIYAYNPDTFYWPDPFCDVTLGTYLALTYLGNRNASYSIYLVHKEAIRFHFKIPSEVVTMFRERYFGPAENSITWDKLDLPAAARLCGKICDAYGVPVPKFTQRSPPSPNATENGRIFGEALHRHTMYRFFEETPRLVAEKFQKGIPPAAGEGVAPLGPDCAAFTRSTAVYYFVDRKIAADSEISVRDLLQALYCHLEVQEVTGFLDVSFQERQKWSNAYLGIIHRILRSEASESGTDNWPTISDVLEAEFE